MPGRTIIAASAFVAALLLHPSGTAVAGANEINRGDAASIVLAHASGGAGYGRADPEWHRQMHEWMQGQGHAPGYPMGPGMMQGPMMGPGYQRGPGMMQGQGPMMAPGYQMGPGMMQGWGPIMGPGSGMGPGMMYGLQEPGGEVTVDDVRSMLERNVEWHGNPNLKVGSVEESEDGEIVAEIVTQDGSLVNRFRVDPATGRWAPAN